MRKNIESRKIAYVRVKDFQTHVDSTVYFDNGMNLIVGTSDSGKTALAKAINFVIYNINDSEYVRFFAKQLEVEIHFVDGSIIKRIKSKDLNQVSFKYPEDFDFTTFAAFGTQYPDEVLEFLGNPILSKVLGALSYSDQKNKLFLIDLPASAQPKIISTVIGTDDLQKATDFLSTDVRTYSEKIKNTEQTILEIEERLETDYDGLDEKIKTVSKIEKTIKDIESANVNILLIDSDLKSFNSINKRGEEAKKKKSLYSKISTCLSNRVADLELSSVKIENMNSLLKEITNKNKKITNLEKTINKFEKIINSDLDNKIKKIESSKDNIEKLKKSIESFEKNNNSQNNILNKINSQKSIIEEAEIELQSKYSIIKANGWHCKGCNKFGGEQIV